VEDVHASRANDVTHGTDLSDADLASEREVVRRESLALQKSCESRSEA
jgi:hypothetical protein